MAIYNEILVGRFSRLVQKIFSIKGSNPAKQIAGEIMPVFPLPNGVENRHPESWFEYSLGITVAAVAAQIGFLQFRNPLGSGVLAVIEQISVSDGVNDQWIVSITNATQADATVKNVFGLDSRNHSFSSVTISTGTAASPALSLNTFVGNTLNSQTFQIIQTHDEQMPVLPGLTVRIQNQTVNTAINITIRWRERPIEESESF